MGRSDFTPLAVPGWADDAPVETTQPVNAVSDFLGRRTDFIVQQIPPEAQPAIETSNQLSRDKAASQPERCPHCSAGLSALELKFERCMACGKPFGASAAAQDGSNQPMLVHI